MTNKTAIEKIRSLKRNAENDMQQYDDGWDAALDKAIEARDLIDKQEALIKEMQEALNGFRVGNCFCECGIDNPMMNGRHTKNCIQANAILEKSKDYA